MNGWRNMWRDLREYKRNSILVRNFLITVLLLMVPLGIVHLLVYSYNDASTREEISRSHMNELERIKDTMDNSLLNLENVSLQLGSQPDFASILKDDFSYPFKSEQIDKIQRIQYAMRMTQLTNTSLGSIFVYVEEKEYLITGTSGGHISKYDSKLWYNTYRNRTETTKSWTQFLGSGRGESGSVTDSMTHFRQLPLYGTTDEKTGLLFISFNMDQLNQFSSVQAEKLYIIDSQGRIVYAPHSEMIGRSFVEVEPEAARYTDQSQFSGIVHDDGMDYTISSLPSTYQDWQYISVLSLKHYYAKQVKFKQFMLLLILLAIISSLLFAFVISLQSYRPISGILSMLKRGEAVTGNRNGKLNEIKYISSSISNSNEQRREMERELQDRYELLKKSQAIALQAQIKPHFLYNTLELINLKAIRMTKGKNEVSEMILTLSRLLRLSLITEDDIIPLRTELEHARIYIQMQQLRLKDQLEVSWKVNENILDYDTIKLTLQPILENAVYHGIQPSSRKGIISIIGYAEAEAIILKIKDNGIGLPRSVVDEINQSFLQTPIRQNESIGLRNVNQRIQLVFGSDYGLRLASREGEGTLVEMRIPKRMRK
jgi:two-component system sensor histidine kinase YesM